MSEDQVITAACQNSSQFSNSEMLFQIYVKKRTKLTTAMFFSLQPTDYYLDKL